MTPRTEAGRALLADARAFAVAPVESWAVDALTDRVLTIEAEQDTATRKELAAKVAALTDEYAHEEGDHGWGFEDCRAAVLTVLSGEPEPK